MLLLLQDTWMHLMQSGRERGREICMWCISRSLVFVILSYKLLSCDCPFRRPLQGKLNVPTTVRVWLQFVCKSAGIMGWLFEWNFFISLCVTIDHVSEQRFVRCYCFERCVILSAMTAKSEMTLKRRREGERRRKGKAELWRYEVKTGEMTGGERMGEIELWVRQGKELKIQKSKQRRKNGGGCQERSDYSL